MKCWMWKNWIHCCLLVGLEINTATLENSLSVPQNVKGRVTIHIT